MRFNFLGVIAAVCGGCLFNQFARADTKLTAGVGSFSGYDDISAPVITLAGGPATAADTIEVRGHGGGGGHGGGMAHGGGGFHGGGRVAVGVGRVGFGGARIAVGRSWGWGGAWGRPWGWGWNRGWGWGWNRGWGWGWNRPWIAARPWGWGWGWNRRWIVGPSWSGGWGPGWGVGGGPCDCGPVVYSFSSPVIVNSPIIVNNGNWNPAASFEIAPPPVPNEPGPVPQAPRPASPRTPPVPQPPPAVDTIARRPIKKLEYPAYGETPGKVIVRDPLLVKNGR
jgi:hypothetical protein